MKKKSRFLYAIVLLVFGAGCNTNTAIETVQGWADAIKTFFRGAPADPKGVIEKLSGENPSDTASAKPEDQNKLAFKMNSELLAEMMIVVFNQSKEAIEITEFKSLVNSLNEGASLEGIYRGLIAGPKYRGMESSSSAALPQTVKAFAIEMATIQDGMKHPRVFKASDAKAIPTIEYPDGTETPSQPAGGVGNSMNFGQAAPTPTPDGKKLFEQRASQYAQIFVGASVYTLKRILCEEALSRLDELGIAHDQVAQWYVKHVMRLNNSKVDFGLTERNNGDQDFHLKWALQVSDDRIKWEVLNRYHRYLNAL